MLVPSAYGTRRAPPRFTFQRTPGKSLAGGKLRQRRDFRYTFPVRPLAAVSVALVLAAGSVQAGPYAWTRSYDAAQSLETRIAPPDGYARVPAPEGSFGRWLRGLPLKAGRPPVHLYDGTLKGNQEAHWAVVDIDAGTRDLQQCADAVMRLRAEYLFAAGRTSEISFNFTSGDAAAFARWADGFRPHLRGGRVSWARDAKPDSGVGAFRAYLDTVFNYAGTASLVKELSPVRDSRDIEIGDVFIVGGHPGHAVLVVDVAVRKKDGQKVFLIAQSYMPAQEIHVLRNPAHAAHPWYDAEGSALETPEWTFHRGDLRRF